MPPQTGQGTYRVSNLVNLNKLTPTHQPPGQKVPANTDSLVFSPQKQQKIEESIQIGKQIILKRNQERLAQLVGKHWKEHLSRKRAKELTPALSQGGREIPPTHERSPEVQALLANDFSSEISPRGQANDTQHSGSNVPATSKDPYLGNLGAGTQQQSAMLGQTENGGTIAGQLQVGTGEGPAYNFLQWNQYEMDQVMSHPAHKFTPIKNYSQLKAKTSEILDFYQQRPTEVPTSDFSGLQVMSHRLPDTTQTIQNINQILNRLDSINHYFSINQIKDTSIPDSRYYAEIGRQTN